MENIKLEVLTRDKKESPHQLLEDGFVPAVLYGAHVKENLSLKIKASILEKVFLSAGEATLIDLIIDGQDKNKKVLIKDSQKHPTKNNLIHIDFYEVDMKKEVNAVITLNFVGESKAVKEMSGVLIKSIDEIEVKSLPGNLVGQIDVDISGLDGFDDVIKLTDIKLPEGIELAHEGDTAVANVAPPREEIEEEKEEVLAEGEEVPAEGEEAKEGEAGAKEDSKAEGGEKKKDGKEAPAKEAAEKK